MFARDITRHYVTDDPTQVAYLCTLDASFRSDVKVTPQVCALHVGSHWSYWSDGKIIYILAEKDTDGYAFGVYWLQAAAETPAGGACPSRRLYRRAAGTQARR